MFRMVLASLLVTLAVGRSHAHYHLILLAAHAAKEGQAVGVRWAFGHPFEHEFANAERPTRFQVFAPDGANTDLLPGLRPAVMAGSAEPAKGPAAFALSFTLPRRGDYVFWAEAAPHVARAERTIYQDSVKVVLHTLQSQRGWDRAVAAGSLELVPLTRPYGLEPGLVFQAQALDAGKPLAGAVVEVERHNPAAPKAEELPADEQITRKTKTDPNGIATCTLPDPGWWVITVVTDGGEAG